MNKDYVKPESSFVALNFAENIARSGGPKYSWQFGQVGHEPDVSGEGSYDDQLADMWDWINRVLGK